MHRDRQALLCSAEQELQVIDTSRSQKQYQRIQKLAHIQVMRYGKEQSICKATPVTRRLCYRSENIKGTRSNSTVAANDDPAAWALEVLDVSLEDSILQGTNSGLERHTTER